MTNSPMILCFGELLIDMIATSQGDLIQAEGFLKKFGGAPANTAIGLAKLGLPVQFMGKVGNDPFGKFLKQTLDENYVDSSTLLLSDSDKTTLAFVSLAENGERDFTFYLGAHETISEKEVSLPENTSIFHFGSLTQTNDVTRAATDTLLTLAKEKDIIISYDPNIRESLWGDLTHAREIILATAKQVDILKLNEEEALLLSRKQIIEEAVTTLFSENLDALLVTLGSKGCFYKTKKYSGTIPTIKVEAIDTTGAGDAFNAGYLEACFKSNKPFSEMTEEELKKSLSKAAVIAALTTTKKGAITAFPTKEEIAQKLTQL